MSMEEDLDPEIPELVKKYVQESPEVFLGLNMARIRPRAIL